MCQYSAKDGVPDDWHLVHLGSRAVGGAGPGDHRDDRRLPRGPHHPRLRGAVERHPGRRVEARGGLRASAHSTATHRHAARARRPQGELGSCPWEGDAAADGDAVALADARALGAALRARAAHTPKEMDAADLTRVQQRLRRRGAARRALRLRLRRAAHGPRLPALELPLAALQPPHRRVRRLAREAHALPARGVRGGARGVARRTSRWACASRPPTGWGPPGRRIEDTVELAQRARGAGLRRHRRVDRRQRARVEARVRPHVPGALRRGGEGRPPGCR